MAQLRASHVFPEFFYEGVYGEQHTTLLASKSSRRTPQKLQKGLREHLLCQDCEQKFGRYESHVAKTLRRADEEFDCGKDRVALVGVNFPLLHLFALSLLWRAHVAKADVWRAVQLGPHGEVIRARLLADDPGPATEYGFAIVKITGLGMHGTMLESPQRVKFHGFWVYQFMARGYLWFLSASKGAPSLAAKLPFVGTFPKLLIPAYQRDRDKLFRNIRNAFPNLFSP